MHRLARLAQLAARQHGVVTIDQASELGVGPKALSDAVAHGFLDPVVRGVYRWVGSVDDDHQQLMASLLANRGAAARRSGLWLRGLWSAPPEPEFVVAYERAPRSGPGRRRRTLLLPESHLTTVGAFPVTTVPRTLVDAAAVLGDRPLEQVVHAALHRRLTTVEELSQVFRSLARRGRPGIARMRRLLEVLDPAMAPAESALEVTAIRVLRDAGLPAPVRQHRVRAGGREYRLDLAYPELLVAIECDGFRHHGGPTPFELDRRRSNALTAAGWRLVHATHQLLARSPLRFVRDVEAARCAASTSPAAARHPPHEL